MAQQELCAPNASREGGVLITNVLQAEVSFIVEETLISVHRTLKNLCLAKRL